MCYDTITGEAVIGWTQPGEWLSYTIDVQQAGFYSLTISNACRGVVGSQHIEIDGVNVTGAMQVPLSGDWNTYLASTKPGVFLSAGQHTLTLVVDSNNVGNINAIVLDLDTPTLNEFFVKTVESTQIVFQLPQTLSTNFSIAGYYATGGVTNNYGSGPGPITWGVGPLRPKTPYTFCFYVHNLLTGDDGPTATTNLMTLPVPTLQGVSVLWFGVTNMVFQIPQALSTNYSVGCLFVENGMTNSSPGTAPGPWVWTVNGLKAGTTYVFGFYQYDLINHMTGDPVFLTARTLARMNQVLAGIGGDGRMRLYMAGLARTNYVLDRTFSLSPPLWVPLATNQTLGSGLMVFTNSPEPATNNFWRIRLAP
jgi:hypothetical protein